MGTKFGLVRFESGNVSMPAASPGFSRLEISSIHQDKNGAIWFCSAADDRGGVFRFDDGAFRHIGPEQGLPSERVFDIAETSDGVLWFATAEGLVRFNGTTFLNYTMDDGLTNEWVRDIFVDEDDVLWLANGWGVSRFDPEGVLGFSKRDGLKGRSGHSPSTVAVFVLEPDLQGGFWVGTQWGGAYRIARDGSRPTLTSIYPEAGYVRQIHRADDGTLWFGTASGVFKQTNGSLTKVLDQDWIIALSSDDQGRLWFGHGWIGGGVSRYDPVTGKESFFRRKQGLPDDQVWAMERKPEGGVWIGTEAGLASGEGDTIKNWSERSELTSATVFDLRYDADGTLSISTSRGLHQWRENKVVSVTAADGLPDQRVWGSARTADGILWLATNGHGLVAYDGRAMTVLDERDGFMGNRAFALAPDRDGALWVGFSTAD